ncbi:TPA: response regulator, partial [Candidatus Micrarchaeota archaeon]|nr:response regulator [Candidatus Micrarchaeota archaeon]
MACNGPELAKKKVRVLVADDHPVALAGLEEILRGAGFEVVGHARTGREALELIRELV